MSRTLLFHDTFLMRGGAERMNIEIAKILSADIATAVWKSDCYDARAMGFEGDIFEVNPDFRKGMLGFLRMKWKFFCSRKLLAPYDSIFFSNEAISGIWNIKPGTKTYYYAHSISRHLFDLSDQYLAKVPWYAKIPYRIMAYFLRKLYIAEVRKVDVIFVNSLKNKERMREWFGRDDAIVLYPPVDTSRFAPVRHREAGSDPETNKGIHFNDWIASQNSQGRKPFCHPAILPSSYYLSFSRLTHAKRVDAIIEAFKSMPDKNLLVLYGEHDSQKEEFMELAGINRTHPPTPLGMGASEKYPNITFLSLEDNEDLPAVIGGATATIAISREEDFGMVAIESMACGIPVIAVDEGGYRETVIDGKTGKLIEIQDSKFKIQDLREIVQKTQQEEWEAMKNDCIARASEFSLESFKEKLKAYLS